MGTSAEFASDPSSCKGILRAGSLTNIERSPFPSLIYTNIFPPEPLNKLLPKRNHDCGGGPTLGG